MKGKNMKNLEKNLENSKAWMDKFMKQRQRVFRWLILWFIAISLFVIAGIGGLVYLLIYIINSPAVQKFLGYN